MKKMKLFDLAWPIFIETALFMLLGFIDVFILSQYNDIAASSINTANQAISIATLVFTVISGASAVLISQYLGAGKKKSASRIAALSITFNLLFGVIVSLIFVLFSDSILAMIGASGDVMIYASQYLRIVGGSIFMQALLNAMAVIVRNHGLTKITMYMSFGMNVVNALLDSILVLGLFGMPRLGVAGVAIATVFSRTVGTIVLTLFLFRKVESFSIFRMIIPFPKRDILNIIKIGVPSALETFLYNLSQLVLTSIVLIYLTDTELITKTYVQNITMFFYLFSVAVGQASQIITGHYVGAGKYDEAYRQGLRGYLYALAISLTVCVIGIIFRYQLLGIFTSDTEIINLGASVIIINIILEFGRTTNLVLIACLRGAGDVYFPTICAIFSMWLISVLGTYIFAVLFGLGIYGLWIGITADEIFRGIFMIIRWKRGKWRNKSIVKKQDRSGYEKEPDKLIIQEESV